MRSFLKYVLATVTGVVISTIILLLVLIGIIGAMVSSAMKDKATVVAENSILHIPMDHLVSERTIPNPFEELDIPGFEMARSLGLDDILHRIKSAETDDKIKGILLDVSYVSANFASLQEIRDALVRFKESDKFIVAYSEAYSQRAYYLASTADEIYVNPEGALDFRGLAAEISFIKGTLDKLGIDMQVVKVGTFKSAVEPLIQDKMSEANREQVSSYMGSIYQHFLADIAVGRGISTDSLHRIADQFLVRTAEDAVTYGLADGLLYKDELLENLKERLEIDSKKDINSVSLRNYKPSRPKAGASVGRDRIAVVYAVGTIAGGEGGDESIGSEKISRELRRLRRDDKVKAVVLRINSPGGSALASEVIWREVDLLRQEKPVIVSMGDVAASGGYYIAAAADSIFAQPNTITGSIGVFGTIPNMKKLWNNHLGITFDGVKTGKYADFLSGSFDRPLSADEQRILQSEVNRIYQTFLKRVADGRNMTTEQVDSIGQGRVWSGEQALANGLVDRLGSIEDAIAAAASKADVEEYQIVKYPAIKDPFAGLLGGTTDKIKIWYGRSEFGAFYDHYESMKKVLDQTGMMAIMPYQITIY